MINVMAYSDRSFAEWCYVRKELSLEERYIGFRNITEIKSILSVDKEHVVMARWHIEPQRNKKPGLALKQHSKNIQQNQKKNAHKWTSWFRFFIFRDGVAIADFTDKTVFLCVVVQHQCYFFDTASSFIQSVCYCFSKTWKANKEKRKKLKTILLHIVDKCEESSNVWIKFLKNTDPIE